MNTGELVRILQTYPPDLRVVVNGYEDGYDDLSPERIVPIKIVLNTGQHRWEGRHEDALLEDNQAIDALVIRRASD